MAYCSNCGNKLPDGAKFCNECGTPVPSAQPSAEPQQKQEPKIDPPQGFQRKNICPQCGGTIQYQTQTEEQGGTGCAVYVFLAIALVLVIAFTFTIILPVIGFVIIVILITTLGKKDKVTVTYAVCQNCGYRHKMVDEKDIPLAERIDWDKLNK